MPAARAGLGQPHQHGLAAGDVTAALDQLDPRQQLCVAVHQSLTGRVPGWARRLEPRETRRLVVGALHHQLGAQESS